MAVCDPPPTGVDELDEEEEDLEFHSAGELEEGSAEFLLENGGNAAQTFKPTMLEQADQSAGTVFSRESQSESEV